MSIFKSISLNHASAAIHENEIARGDIRGSRLTIIALSIQLAVIALIGLDIIGIHIPIMRQAVCFIYLTFLPGVLILKLLGFQKMGATNALLYAVGLSLFFIMLVGLAINFLYPLIGIIRPISVLPLLITMSCIISIFIALCYINENDYFSLCSVDPKFFTSKEALSIYLALFLSIFGTYLVNFRESNLLLLVLIPFEALILSLSLHEIFLKKEHYNLLIFIISLSMLFLYSLFSMYITGADIHQEYFFANLVIQNGIWDPSIFHNVNSILSTTMLGPIYSLFCDIDLTWVYKIIYPFIFSLLPVGLYEIYRRQTDEKIALLACFYFISISPFYGEMLSLPRQMIAEFLIMLIIYLFIDSDIDMIRRRSLLIIFALGLIFSHYGLAMIILLYFLIAIVIIISMNSILGYRNNAFTSGFVMIFLISAVSWYLYVSGGSVVVSITNIIQHVYDSFSHEVLQTYSVNFIMRESNSISAKLLKAMYLISQFLIPVGLLRIIFASRFNHKTEIKFKYEFVVFSFVSMLLMASFFITSWTGMNIHRLYHFVLIFLAPFSVIGGYAIFEMISKIKSRSPINYAAPKKAMAIFLIVFLLLDSGWTQEIFNERMRSLPMGSLRIKNSSDPDEIYNFYNTIRPETDILGIEWISKMSANRNPIYSDTLSINQPLLSYGGIKENSYNYSIDTKITRKMESNSYLYLDYYDLHYKLGVWSSIWNYKNLASLISYQNHTSLIYSNADCNIYCKII